MARQYNHVQEIAEEVFRRKAEGQTNREIHQYTKSYTNFAKDMAIYDDL